MGNLYPAGGGEIFSMQQHFQFSTLKIGHETARIFIDGAIRRWAVLDSSIPPTNGRLCPSLILILKFMFLARPRLIYVSLSYSIAG